MRIQNTEKRIQKKCNPWTDRDILQQYARDAEEMIKD